MRVASALNVGSSTSKGRGPFRPAATADGRRLVLIRHPFHQQVISQRTRDRQDLSRIPVIQLQNGGSALCLDADTGETELPLLASTVDGLRVIVENQQGIAIRIDHLHDQLEPLRLEIMAFVDQHCVILA
jgi:hypothetical protein